MNGLLLYKPKSGFKPEFDSPHLYEKRAVIRAISEIETSETEVVGVESFCGKHALHIEEPIPITERNNFKKIRDVPDKCCDRCQKESTRLSPTHK